MTTVNTEPVLHFYIITCTESFFEAGSRDFNITATTDEKKAIDIADKLNKSSIYTPDSDMYYEVQHLTNQLSNLGTNHRDPVFVEIGLRQVAHRELLKSIEKQGQCALPADKDWMEAALDNLCSLSSGCSEMTRDRVEGIVMDTVRDGIKLDDHFNFKRIYQCDAAYYDGLAEQFGLRIIA